MSQGCVGEWLTQHAGRLVAHLSPVWRRPHADVMIEPELGWGSVLVACLVGLRCSLNMG